ncbi:2-hydroxy-3-oxopropionate reductase [Clostridium tyrobutyricum]|uniref:2-hydroxy-3-oxopropionate reductase n=1 Tax=Clostridium tyrobutyricum TaxID=1519 RepID=UPI0005803C2D|nr:2-hydroxy-3-oxopropionate reductase [Clostridium tyrobutyricum]
MGKNIGFIGLGIMGRPMVLNLMKAGHNVTVYDINRDVVEKLASKGAAGAESPRETAENKDIIFTMLPNSKHVEQVVLGENGVIEGCRKGSVIVDMSSISPVVSKKIASEVNKKSVEMLDAPVSGGETGAIDGTLAIMVGGKEEVFDKVKSVLLDMGKTITLVGDNGCGCTAKLANQIIVNLNIAAMSEALVFAAKAGIDIEKMYNAIRGGLAGSAVLDQKVPKILDRDFAPGGKISINLKDITNVMETAHDIDAPLPLASVLLEIFHALKADGKENDDHGGVVQFYEKIANVQVKRR